MSYPLAAFLYRYNLVGDTDSSVQDTLVLADRTEFAIIELVHRLADMPDNSSDEDLQKIYYDIGNEVYTGELRLWFKIVYLALLGELEGPRLGVLTNLLGISNTIALIDRIRFEGWMHKVKLS